MAEDNLIGLTVHQARDIRWKLERSKSTGHPLAEAYEKLIDALAFLAEANRQGCGVQYFEERAYELAEEVHSDCWHRFKDVDSVMRINEAMNPLGHPVSNSRTEGQYDRIRTRNNLASG